MKNLEISLAAKSDLLDIWDFLSYDSARAADRVLKEITSKLDTLLAFPEMGRKRDELDKGLRSFPVKNYIIFYYITDDGIEISRVLHGSQDIEDIFE